MVDKLDWVIMPVFNVDGYEYTHTSVSSNYFIFFKILEEKRSFHSNRYTLDNFQTKKSKDRATLYNVKAINNYIDKNK